MKLDLFPTNVGIWDVALGAVFDKALYEALLKVNANMQTGEHIWERQSHNIFDGGVQEASRLAEAVIPLVQKDFIGSQGRIVSVQGREVVRSKGVEIMPHSDEDECHLQAVYFPFGPELQASQEFFGQVNVFGPNGFAICNPDWRSSGFGKYLMPWESASKFWIKPHRGLLIAFDARAVHFQKPYDGEQPFMNILLNIKVERING